MSFLRIIDVSAYQGPTVPSCDVVFVKATEGTSYTSSRFAAQWASAKKQASARGAYHFARPEQSSAVAQADRLIATAAPQPRDLLCLDLEASGLGQAGTNAWARLFGQRLRERAPGIRTVLYMGAGYASNGTGKGLADFYDLWWYPQYPSTARTSTWPSSFSPWLPSGLTCGWSRPHIWQWTDNFGGLDASISPLTLDELAGGGQPQKETDVYGGIPPLQVGHRITRTCPKGSLRIIGIAYDSMNVLTYRIAAHSQSGGGKIEATLKVGGPNSDKDSWPRKATWQFPNASEVDWFSIELIDGDPSQPDANGKVVEPGWDAS